MTNLTSTAFVIFLEMSLWFLFVDEEIPYLPCLDGHPNALPEKNDVARVLIIVEEIKQDNQLNKHVGDNL